MSTQRESMEYDVVIVGAGAAGLATAIAVKQCTPEISVCVLEKAAEVGAHIMSGAIMDPSALTRLIPDWQQQQAPLTIAVTRDEFYFLHAQGQRQVPQMLLPPCFHNDGNYVVRLGEVVSWLGQQAESLGVEIFPGFAAVEVLYDEHGAVKGVATGDMGLDKQGQPTSQYQPGIELWAKYTVFAEGSRGQLGRQLNEHFALDKNADPQSYAIGLKEVWEIPAEHARMGTVIHTGGWPLDDQTYGGGFIYHLDQNRVAVGFVVGLDYQNPWLSPFDEFQRFKTHPLIRPLLEQGKRLSFGARTITAGGLLSLPELAFPGGVLVGCEAGFLNASRIKGSHAAIESGRLAGIAIAHAVQQGLARTTVAEYPQLFQQSDLYQELYKARNFKQWFKKGRLFGTLMTGIEQTVLRGHIPWTIHRTTPDFACLRPAHECQPIVYPAPDGVVTFDRPSSVYLTNTNHDDNEPTHLTLKNHTVPLDINWKEYAGPEQRYCPAGVYEYLSRPDGQMYLQINAQNCLHCKTCDAKDPTQNVVWVAPQGGEGPMYNGM